MYSFNAFKSMAYFPPLDLWTRGVPQGSLLTPNLFNIYTHDIPLTDNNQSHKGIYADETAALAQIRSPRMVTLRLQKNMGQLAYGATLSWVYVKTPQFLSQNEVFVMEPTKSHHGKKYQVPWTDTPENDYRTPAKAKRTSNALHPLISYNSKRNLKWTTSNTKGLELFQNALLRRFTKSQRAMGLNRSDIKRGFEIIVCYIVE